MAKVRAILWTYDQTKDGKYPIKIRISQDRKYKYLPTGKYCFKNEWNEKEQEVKKPHKNIGLVNAAIDRKKQDVKDIIDKAIIEQEILSLDQIVSRVQKNRQKVTAFKFGCDRIKSLHMRGKFAGAKDELAYLNNIYDFRTHNTALPKETEIANIKARRKERMGSKNQFEERVKLLSNCDKLTFDEIDAEFIKLFKAFCEGYLGHATKTVTNQLIYLRTLFNEAIKQGIVKEERYPFGSRGEKIRHTAGNKIGLTKEEVKRLEDLELDKGSAIWHTRNVWLFSFYFAGMRIADVLKLQWSDFMDGRLYYTMNKNDKPVSLAIPEKAQNILSFYASDKKSHTDFVFPYLKKADPKNEEDVFTKTRTATKLLNKYLKRIADQCGIQKKLTNHIARHTFGNIAGDSIHPLMLQKLYRHTDLKTTLNYQANFINKEADDALMSVINS